MSVKRIYHWLMIWPCLWIGMLYENENWFSERSTLHWLYSRDLPADAVTEEEVREDERQACWEDFIHVMRQAIKDSPASFELKALHEAIFLQGWRELGTGDGKPMHRRKDSAVSEWLTTK